MIFRAVLCVVASLGMLHAQVVAGPNRPAKVPEGYVITPFGYFHPSCVRHLAEEETVLADGRVQHADGTEDAEPPVCNYPRYTPTGELITADTVNIADAAEVSETKAPIINGWLEYISATTPTSYGEISATWTVPPAPTSNDRQTIFFFPGFQDIKNTANESIVQPVLGWDSDFYNEWGIASWNCCLSGTADESSPVHVSVGDEILGTITSMCSARLKFCSKWNVLSEDQTTGKSTTLRKTPTEGQVWNWAFGAVLEVYGVRECSDYPANTDVVFNVEVYDKNLKEISNPGWSEGPASLKTTPKCNYGLNTTATQETLDY